MFKRHLITIMNKKKILIIGSTGFVGKKLNLYLKNKNYNVFGFSKSTGVNLLNQKHIEKKLASIKPEYIINCAANTGSLHYVIRNSADIVHDNIVSTLNIYNAAKKLKKRPVIINLLANCSYDGNAKIQKESLWWNGMPHKSALSFGASRRLTHVISEGFLSQYKIISKNFIIPGIYGPGNHLDTEKVHALDGLIIRMINAKLSNASKFYIWGTGKPIREWCYIDDLIKFIEVCIKTNKKLIYPINLGQKKGYSIKFLAKLISKEIKFKGKIVYDKKYQDGAPIKILDNSNFKKSFRNFKFTEIKKGIKKSIDYYNKILKD